MADWTLGHWMSYMYTWPHQHSVMIFFITQTCSQHISMVFKARPVQEAELIKHLPNNPLSWSDRQQIRSQDIKSSKSRRWFWKPSAPRTDYPNGKLPRWVKYTWLASTPLPWDHCGDHCRRFHGDHHFMEIIVKIGICILSSRSSICQTTRWVEVIGSKIIVETSSRTKAGADSENQAPGVLTNPAGKNAKISDRDRYSNRLRSFQTV